MTEINHHLRSIKEVLGKTYKVPFYQREYRWKRKQFEELLNDLQEEFLNHFEESHGRDRVAQYKSYFLGTVLTTTDSATSRKIIIDGQQRLTSLTLFFIYSLQRRRAAEALNITDYTSLIQTESYGERVLNFEADNDRAELINKLSEIDDEGSRSFDFVGEASEGTKNLFHRFNDIESILNDKIKDEYFAYFSDWVAEKVVLFEIVVPTEHDAHKVFVTMNDRGLNLTPSEMLKGFLLSKITHSVKHGEAHALWEDKIRELKKIDNDEDANFLRTWLRAKYAKNIRGKAAGEEKKDFENIGDSYHRWLLDNKDGVGINTGDDYQSFVLDNFKKYVDLYLKVQKYSSEFTDGYHHIYYNSSKDITMQSMLILSAIKLDDSDSVAERKIQLVSKYLDYYTSLRAVNLKKNTYDNLKDILFSLCLKIRDKTEEELKEIFVKHASDSGLSFDEVDNFTYSKASTKSLLNVLARLAAYIEEGVEQTNSVGYDVYIDRKRTSRTFDIEHILADEYGVFTGATTNNDFDSESEYKTKRNMLGGLILLPRSRNRSLQEKPYSEKVTRYSSENILAQTLTSDFYENNPQVERFLETSLLNLKSYEDFNKQCLEERHLVYKDIVKKIWSIDEIVS
ncbi:DUF262 domain-containing protein [Kistimonas scapharcae]|uniref:DUF262 domain-containing protein n=1 Tax=Kistimonas scapharcae TaxID=1036133 RepID=A0ABP8V8E5_9GAMM